MRYHGKIVKWYDDKGFGFIDATSDGKDVFFHVSNIHQLKKRPEIGEIVTYELTKDQRGRFQAVDISYLTISKYAAHSDSQSTFNLYFIAFFLLFSSFVIERTLKDFLPQLFLFIFIGANLVSFLLYYQDKVSANKNEWRTAESTLHLFSLAGGWGGAYIAQKTFRHKHKKASFMLTYKLTVFVNCAAVIVYSVPSLQQALLSRL